MFIFLFFRKERKTMTKSFIPQGYKPTLSLYETQDAISFIKREFQDNLARALHLKRVSAPLFVQPETGLNDNLNGYERPVGFDIPFTGKDAQVVQSLAKWKRMALYRYDFHPGNGLYTDMNAIRRDEELDNLHSVYVDQWDWEKVITPDTRNLTTLKNTVTAIVGCVCNTLDVLKARYNFITTELSRDVFFITTQELLDMYPDKTPKERENAITKEHRTVFIMQIGDLLSNGEKHDGRSPDYDDWTMNGEIGMRILMLEMAGEYDKIYDPATKTYGVDVVEVPGTAIKAEALREDHTVENLADVAGETYGNLGYLSVADWMPAELIH